MKQLREFLFIVLIAIIIFVWATSDKDPGGVVVNPTATVQSAPTAGAAPGIPPTMEPTYTPFYVAPTAIPTETLSPSLNQVIGNPDGSNPFVGSVTLVP